MLKAAVPALLLLLLAAPAEATFCADPGPYVIEIDSLPGDSITSVLCGGTGFFCKRPKTSGPSVQLADPSCDPSLGPCTVVVRVPLEFPGLEQNFAEGGTNIRPVIYYFDQASPPDCEPFPAFAKPDCSNTAIALCGSAGGPQFNSDFGQTTIALSSVTCDNVAGLANVLSLSAWMCGSSLSCRVELEVPSLAFGGPGVALAIGCGGPPPQQSCHPGGGAMCQQCLPGGANVDGSTPTFGDTGGAGPMTPVGLAYTGGGVGASGLPGSGVSTFPGTSALVASMHTGLGRHWTHAYSERIVPDPDASQVWLLTAAGTFHRFTDGDLDGTYDQVEPTDDYRTLTHDPATGWTLTDLDGTVDAFDTAGLWLSTTDRNGNTTQATYSASGLLERVDLPDARAYLFSYDASGLLMTITEEGVDGSTRGPWTLTWTSGDLTRIDRPDVTALEFTYADARWPGFLTRVELVGTSGGRRILRAFQYDDLRRVTRTWKGDVSSTGPDAVDLHTLTYPSGTQTQVTDPLGVPATWTYERTAGGATRVTSITGDCPVCGSGPNAQFAYGDVNHPLRVTMETDGKGHQTAFEYDPRGQVTRRIEAVDEPILTRDTTWEYHPTFPALPTRIIQPSVDGINVRETMMDYDPLTGDLLSSTISGVENGSAFLLSTLHTVNTAGETTSVDPPGFGTTDATTFTYDSARGDLVPLTRTDPLIGATSFGYDALNRRISVTDPNGVTTETEYDELSRVTRITQKGEVTAEDLTTQHIYSEFGDLLRTILPRGNVISYGYDSAGGLVSIERKPDAATPAERTLFTLDPAGNRTQEKLQSWTGAAWVTASATDFVYSSRCHLDRVIQAPGTPEEAITDYAFDCNGNLAQVWDANRSSGTDPPSTTYSYDALDRLVSLTQPWAGGGTAVTAYAFDVQDHLTAVTDAEGNTTSYTYSDRDLLTREVSPVSGTTTHSYNEHGELTQTTDARAITVTRTVDELDRVTFVDYPGTPLDVTYTYDDPAVPFSLGRLTAITRTGRSILYAYDRFGRTTQDGQLSYAFDENGNHSEIHYPDGVTASYGYDFADRQQSLDVQVGANPAQTLVTSSSYLPSGPLSSLTLGNGLTETRSFDGRYVPTRIQVPGRLDWTYSTDGVGNVLSITDGLGATQNRTYAYQDVHYFLAQGNGPWGTRSWSYDKIGNRLTEIRDGVTDTYSYASNGSLGNTALLTQISLGTGGTKTYQHGPAGHLTEVNAAGNQILFESDAEGRLSALERPLAKARTEMLYDGRSFLAEAVEPHIFSDGFESGNLACWSSVVGGTKTGTCPTEPTPDGRTVSPTYSSEGLLHARTAEGVSELVLYFAGRPVAVLSVTVGVQQGLSYLTTDHLGTPVLATNAAGVALWNGGFEPFGEDWNGASTAGVFLRFPGQWDDAAWAEAGLGAEVYYNVHRWPQVGLMRYSRPDPLGVDAGVNLFLYAASNPLVYFDPLGLSDCCTKTWSDCWGECIEARRLDYWQVIPFSALPKRILPPFRIPNPKDPLTSIPSAIGHLLGGRSSRLGSLLRTTGRFLSRIATPVIVFEGFFDATTVVACIGECSSDPCQNFLPFSDIFTITPGDLPFLIE